ncbi:MAG: DUF4340 domain-containing protein [Agathobacter sp.]|uniref:DUF4340 domain-containing protein n=1 Tax=Agathobacter sp. TaxID=2021311 RepID=UPI002E78DB97|nr:DUF4340 domain-containing protein [Agathobacter sp.]MEE1216332.1 DUF4340 domain-containing protein [Agathobacter sp.]
MNKQKRTFVILAIVLVACLAGYLGLLNYNKYKSDDDSESESDSVEALSLDSSDVKSLSFLLDGQEYTFSRIKSEDISDETESTESEKTDTESETNSDENSTDDEQWVCDNDTSLKINTSKVTSLLGNVTSITASKKFDSDADTSDFGLDEPQNVVKLSTDDKTYTITIGEKNAMLGEYYIKVNDDVYLSSNTILGSIPDSIDDMVASEDSESTETESE